MTDNLPPPHVVDIATCTGEVHDHGAQVTAWAPSGSEPVLYVSTAVSLRTGEPIRAGVPVCWPWFGAGRHPGMMPSHGIARTAEWELVERVDEPGAATFVHRLTDEAASSEHWPHPYALEARSRLGASLEIALTTTNTGNDPFDYEEALHAYLAVGDVYRVTLDGLIGKSFFDKVIQSERRQTGPVRLTGETDAVFRATGSVVLDDASLDRRLVVSTKGMSNVIVWNPWVAKAAEVDDIGDGDWQRFICVEGGNVLENAVTLQPGQAHTSTYTVELTGR